MDGPGMTDQSPPCPACGARHADGQTCADDFNQLLGWEYENPALWEVHNLTVLCYHLQHPHLYSPDGLTYGLQLLVTFVDEGVSPAEVRRRSREQVNSHNRQWKITARPGAEGRYARLVAWTMRAADVVAGGADSYIANVRAWAATLLADLRASGNLPLTNSEL
jgi:hypothetical protein